MPDPARERLERGLEHLGRHLDLVSEAEVVVDAQARRSRRPVYLLDVTVRLRGHNLPPLHARHEGRGMSDLVDVTLATLDREVRRVKDRVKTHP